MNPDAILRSLSRRQFLGRCGIGLGKIGAATLLAESAARCRTSTLAGDRPFEPKRPHFRPRAKAVIHLFMAGAPSQLDLFDPETRAVIEIRRLAGAEVDQSSKISGTHSSSRDADVDRPVTVFEFAQHGE